MTDEGDFEELKILCECCMAVRIVRAIVRASPWDFRKRFEDMQRGQFPFDGCVEKAG